MVTPGAGKVGKAGLKVLLVAVGFLLVQASRRSPWMRNQINKDMVLEVSSADGVAHHLEFVRESRRIISRRGPAPAATLKVRFDTAGHGFRALIDPHPVRQVVNGILAERITVDGNTSLLLWFHGLTRIVVPIGRHRPRRAPLPGALLEPNPNSRVYRLVTREPVAETLDPEWTAAAVQRQLRDPLQKPSCGQESSHKRGEEKRYGPRYGVCGTQLSPLVGLRLLPHA
jgi:hypothetical protein